MSSKTPAGEAHSQSSSWCGAQRRKSFSKRPLVHSDDDDNDGPVPTQRTKRARTADIDASPSVATTADDDSGMDVDVDVLSADDDSRFLPDNATALEPSFSHEAKADTSKKHKKSSAVSASTKKKPQVVYSDDESDSHFERDSVEDDLSDSALPLADSPDDDFELDTPPQRSASKAKASATKGKAGKANLGQIKGPTARGPKEKERDGENFVKDERNPVTTSSAVAQSQPSDLFSNDDPMLSSTVDPLPDASQHGKDPLGQTILKKRKLPQIKKNKIATSIASTSIPTTTTQKPLPAPVQELAKPSLPTSEQRKQALTGVRDIDLGDSKIYAELFKGAGGNTPRSGLKNAEERRKELDKMRDEAKARRAEEAKFIFDLQSQADKIARFERRLRVESSTVLHPNFLAAKFRDEWEIERRSRRVTPKEEGEA